jgi:hypothetical protein
MSLLSESGHPRVIIARINCAAQDHAQLRIRPEHHIVNSKNENTSVLISKYFTLKDMEPPAGIEPATC